MSGGLPGEWFNGDMTRTIKFAKLRILFDRGIIITSYSQPSLEVVTTKCHRRVDTMYQLTAIIKPLHTIQRETKVGMLANRYLDDSEAFTLDWHVSAC
jgi:hypothetical protein